MTLRERIEEAEAFLKEGRIYDGIKVLQDILDEMEEPKNADSPQEVVYVLKAEILRKLKKEVDDDYAEGAREWADILQMLYSL